MRCTSPRRGGLAAACGADRADPRVAGVDQRPLRAPLRPVVDEFRALVEGRYGVPPSAIDATLARAVALVRRHAARRRSAVAEDVRQEAEGLAASEEELVLIALFGEEAETLLKIRGRHTARTRSRGRRAVARRADPRARPIVQESGFGEVEIEDNGMRVSVRRAEEAVQRPPVAPLAEASSPSAARAGRSLAAVRVESPMVGVFYRAPEPGSPPFVEPGRRRRRARRCVCSRR